MSEKLKSTNSRYYLVRSPFRISFFGGGTDYPEYFSRFPGAVLGVAIDKYIYLSALQIGQYQDYKYRLAYSKLENVTEAKNVEHPSVRAALNYFEVDTPIDFSFQADLPASAGLGSSSTFSVGMVQLLSSIVNRPLDKLTAAKLAIHLDRDVLKENVGVQDHLHASFGGLNIFRFSGDVLENEPLDVTSEKRKSLESSLLLVFTGKKRSASEIVSEQMQKTRAKQNDGALHEIYQMVDEASRIMKRKTSDFLPELGELLTEYWKLKKSLSSRVSSSEMDGMYREGVNLGAYGGKLCGAGGGGFFAFLVPEEKKPKFFEHFGEENCISVGIDYEGTKLIFEGS